MVQYLLIYMPLVFGLLSCAPKSDGLDTLFAIDRRLVGNQQFAKDSLLRQVLDGNREIRVCLINEAPEKNGAWLDKVSSGFEAALKTWLAAGSKHTKYPLPTSVSLKFERYSVAEALDFQGLDETAQRKMFRENMDLFERSKKLSDDEFRRNADKFGDIEKKSRSPRDRCASPVIRIESFSQESSYKAYLRKTENPFRSLSLKELAEIENLRNFTKELYERVVLGSKLTSSEREEKRKREEADNEEWRRAAAYFEPPAIDFHQVAYNESNLRFVLLHEVGHLFGLGDVYPERGYRSALAIHPGSIMKSIREFGAVLQGDDVAGLHAVITVAKEGIKSCGTGYSEFNNDADPRSEFNFYCLPQGYQPGLTNHGQQQGFPTYGIQSDKPNEPVSECPTGSVIIRFRCFVKNYLA
jgi:hypothetical protein